LARTSLSQATLRHHQDLSLLKEMPRRCRRHRLTMMILMTIFRFNLHHRQLM
jgi:hypothetical protein